MDKIKECTTPAVKATQNKKIFDTAFNITTWLMQPSIILFLTPMAVLKKVNSNNDVGFKIFTAPVNHNKLDKKKLYKLLTQYWATPTNMSTNSLDKIKILD
jgi:hypothetical protein